VGALKNTPKLQFTWIIIVYHFVVSHEQGRRSEISFISVFLLSLGLVELESLAQLDYFLMVDISSHTDNCVVSGVVIVEKFFNLFLLDVGQNFTDSQSRLPQETVTVGSVVDRFQKNVQLVFVVGSLLLYDLFTFRFDLSFVE
jgi:hypothetical protein